MTGSVGLGQQHKKLYWSAAHYDLVKETLRIRRAFRKTKEQSEQQNLAAEELELWLTYVGRRKEEAMKDP